MRISWLVYNSTVKHGYSEQTYWEESDKVTFLFFPNAPLLYFPLIDQLKYGRNEVIIQFLRNSL